MKLLFRLSILIFFSSLSFTYAQIGINTQTPDPSSAFDITSSSGGILIPRLTNSQKNNISNPATGLMIYQIDSTPGFYFYNGTSWEQLITSVNLLVTSSKIVDGTITSSDLSSGIDATKIGSGLVTDTEFGYIDGLTSSAQTQITGLGTDITTNTTAISANTSSITTLSSTISNLTDSDTTYSSGTGLTLNGTTFSIDSSVVTSTYTGGVTINGTVTATKFVGDGSGLTGVTTTSLGDDIVTSSKIVDGTITSSDLSSGIDATKIGSGLVTDTEFGYIDGLTSSAQTQITGLGTDITTNTTAISANTSSITTLSSTISNLTDSDTTYSSGTGLTLNGTTFSIDSSVVTSTYTGGVTINGTVTATKFVGDGSGLTGISSSSSGLINAGYYSTTEINNLSPNLGDIVYDYTSATLKIYASTPGNYNQKRLSWDTNRTSYNGFNQTAISDKYYYSGKIIKDCYINYLTYYNTMDSQYKHGFVYKDTDRELSNGKGYKVPDGTFFKAGDYIHFEFLSSNANLVDNSQPNTSSNTVYRWNSEYDNNEFLEYIDSFTFKIFYQTRVDAGYPESQWYVDSNNYFALSVGIAPVNKSFKTIIDY